MLEPPTAALYQAPDLLSGIGAFPIAVELSPASLSVLLALGAVFVGALSVMLVYHWRRFPYEQDVFRRVERLYFSGTLVFLAVAVVGILMS